MLVLGIDPGTAITGYGLVTESPEGQLSTVGYGIIQTPKEHNAGQRLQVIFQKLKEIIILHHPESGSVEKLFFQKNVTTALAVGQARGVALLVLAEFNLPVSEYTPMEVKQAVCGYGGASKNQVQQMVKILLNLETLPKPDDAADALAIAICHLSSLKMKSFG
jgi:crossover junction endodeoxyribonuclease RuvC